MKTIYTIRLTKINDTNRRTLFHQLVSNNLQPIGSGEITRRIYLRNPNNSGKQWRKVMRKSHQKQEPEKISFFTAEVKLAFNFWNGLGFPFVRHRIEDSKTFNSAVIKLKKVLEKYDLDQLTEAITLAHETFNSGWFIYKRFFQSSKISLPSFIQYPSDYKKSLPSKMRSIDSWMKEFLLGKEYIEANYSFILKDKYPHATKRLTEAWKTYTKQDTLTTDESNGLIQLAVQIVKFVKVNDNIISELDIADLIDQMLNKWDNRYKPKHPGWMLTPIFWENKLPKALVKYGTFENTRDINLI